MCVCVCVCVVCVLCVSVFGPKNAEIANKIMRQECMISSEGGTLLLRETGTMLRSRDVIQRGPTSF